MVQRRNRLILFASLLNGEVRLGVSRHKRKRVRDGSAILLQVLT